MSAYKPHFSQFLSRAEGRLHFAAHSHHYWPDVTQEAHARAWSIAAEEVDQKWDSIMGQVIPEVQTHIAGQLGLSNPDRIAFASNTHNFVLRLFSCLGKGPLRVLSSDSEFHTFTRQCERYGEAGELQWEQVSCTPFESFEDRFLEQIRKGEHDMVFVSQVFFNSGLVFGGLERLAQAMAHSEALLVIDGYHGFMAIPTDLSAVEDRLFYIAGGYKYAMSGEGVCFMHCPDGYGQRPENTGWFASFGELEGEQEAARVGYGPAGQRFWGATMDPSGLFRMQAVFQWLHKEGFRVPDMHAHVRELQDYFLTKLRAGALPWLHVEDLVPLASCGERGHFLTFRTEAAPALHARLDQAQIITDHRGPNLRFGFAIYHGQDDVDELCRRMQNAP